MSLTAADVGAGQYHVVATRRDGSRYVIESFPREQFDAARNLCARAAWQLEGILSVSVEFDGSDSWRKS